MDVHCWRYCLRNLLNTSSIGPYIRRATDVCARVSGCRMVYLCIRVGLAPYSTSPSRNCCNIVCQESVKLCIRNEASRVNAYLFVHTLEASHSVFHILERKLKRCIATPHVIQCNRYRSRMSLPNPPKNNILVNAGAHTSMGECVRACACV